MSVLANCMQNRNSTLERIIISLVITTIVCYLLPFFIVYYLHDTSHGPDRSFWRIIIFWRTGGIAFHILSTLSALGGISAWILKSRKSEHFHKQFFGMTTLLAFLTTLFLLLFGYVIAPYMGLQS